MTLIETRHLELNNGMCMPATGIGCWMGTPGEGDHVRVMVVSALELGYRHIDTVCIARNEESVGKGIKDSKVPRGEIFLTTKLDQRDHGRVKKALDASLSKLGEDYVDLYLMHWPMAYDEAGKSLQPDESPTFVETWEAMEELLSTGKARAIGVSNFSIKTLSELLKHAKVTPAVNQVELHPCLPQHDLLAFCSERGILLTAYTPLGKSKFVDDPDIRTIAKAHGPETTGAEILLSWGVQRGTAVIPKTVHPMRLKENLQLKLLSAAEMDVLDNFHKKPGMHRSMCGFHTSEMGGSCFGWTYEQLGWKMALGGVHL
ncbi:Aldo/keto reductase [Cubamyces sp. BRFM 1775]|nr:Aldo/keto reductase [Cubamyces sp. BRFM 1775]